MENNKNKKSVKFQGDMLNFCDFIQVFVFTPNHHLKSGPHFKELPSPKKQIGIHTNFTLFSEKKQGTFIRVGVFIASPEGSLECFFN